MYANSLPFSIVFSLLSMMQRTPNMPQLSQYTSSLPFHLCRGQTKGMSCVLAVISARLSRVSDRSRLFPTSKDLNNFHVISGVDPEREPLQPHETPLPTHRYAATSLEFSFLIHSSEEPNEASL